MNGKEKKLVRIGAIILAIFMVVPMVVTFVAGLNN